VKITKLISISLRQPIYPNGDPKPVDRFPVDVRDLVPGEVLFLRHDPRFFWVIGDGGERFTSEIVFREEMEVSEGEEIPSHGFFVFRHETSQKIDLRTISRCIMWSYGEISFLSDYADCDAYGPPPLRLPEQAQSGLAASSLFRLSETFEEMLLDGSEEIKKSLLDGRMIETMLNDRHRGAFLGFEYWKEERKGYVIRSVFETTSEADFVIERTDTRTAKGLLSHF
jgi:hypothetical protein